MCENGHANLTSLSHTCTHVHLAALLIEVVPRTVVTSSESGENTTKHTNWECCTIAKQGMQFIRLWCGRSERYSETNNGN